MSRLHSILLIVLSLVAGFALDAGVTYYAATTPKGQALLRDFLVAQTQKNAAALPPLVASSTMVYTQRTLPVPESYTSYDYFIAINNVINDIGLINNVNVTLGPVLVQLNQKTLSCTYNGFYDLMNQARTLANQNQAMAAQFLIHINTLATANAQTKDAITKVDTLALVAAGQTLGAALQNYATGVQNILYGDTPTSAQVAELESQVNAAMGASQSFADSLKPLIKHIGDGAQAVIDAAAAASSTKK
mgnify:CR=1 FL=1